MNLFELEPEKYYGWSSTYSKKQRQEKLSMMLSSGEYLYSLKTDGNYARFVVQNGIAKLQTRGISTKTQTYGEIQDKVLFFEELRRFFEQDTLIIGEVYLDDGIDKDVGAILRCLPPKALTRQSGEQKLKFRIFDIWYYNGVDLFAAPLTMRITYFEKIKEIFKNSSFISCVEYYEANDSFYEHLQKIFDEGGEGAVLIRKDAKPNPGARTAWKTLKIKKEVQQDIDCFIYGIEPAIRMYTGKDLENWSYWLDLRSGEKLEGQYFNEYVDGHGVYEPITRSYFYGYPGSIICAVMDDNGRPYIICKCAGLTDEFRRELRDNQQQYHMMPLKITGMGISRGNEGQISIRHPKIENLRPLDIDIKDCNLAKIIG